MAGNPRLSSAFIITFSEVIVGAAPGFALPVITAEDLILRIVDDVAESFHEEREVDEARSPVLGHVERFEVDAGDEEERDDGGEAVGAGVARDEGGG